MNHIVYGPSEETIISYESLGSYLFDCLKKRRGSEIIAIDAVTKKTLSVGELLDKSIQLSITLQKLSVKKDDVIALISENSLDCYIVACSTLFCGAQLLLLNSSYGKDEIRHAFKLCRPKIIFSSETIIQIVLSIKEEFEHVKKIFTIERDVTQSIEVIDVSIFRRVKVNLDDTAVICLSSGTTGLPKCVELTNENFISFIHYACDANGLNISSRDTTVLFLPFFHIYGLLMYLAGVIHSLTVIVMKSYKSDIFLRAIEEYKATKLYLVPTILMTLVKNPIVSKFNLLSLEDIIIAAAPLNKDFYEEAILKFQHSVVRQLYGLTETTGPCAIQHTNDAFMTVGKLVRNTIAKVINVHTKVALGPYEKGEIWLKSSAIMKGYKNNPTETNESIDSDGFYHTGDIGYYDEDGNFFLVDRIKEIIKYKGFQVSPTEVEHLIHRHPDVVDCGVVGIKDDRCGELPAAVVVRKLGSNLTEEEIKQFVAGELNHAFKLSNPKVIFSSKTALPHLLSVKKDIDSIESIISIDRNDFVDVQNIEDLINSLKNDDSFAPVVGNATDTAVLCLSSGTTGLPKCVELAHENFIPIMNNFWAADSLNITSKDTSVVFLPFFHIYGFLIHLAAITNSLTIIQMNSFKPDLFLQAIQDYKSTKLFIVPSILQFLVKSPMVSEFNLKSLEDIMVAAAPLSSDIYELAAQRFDTCMIRQLYGSSETGGVCIMQEGTSKRCNVGKVMCNTSIKVISIDTKINLGPYENGEICVKTLSVMKGYLNNPSETKNSFDIDGFYCTGDIGYYDSDNNFYIVDRIKELIKYKGFQVAPAELENILESHPEVRDCGVVGIEDEKCGELPLAFVVRQEGSKITADELIKYVAERISIQKQLHGGVRFVEEIPRTSSGKILRKEFKKMLIK
ncbi:hypothetical protein FQR65_LT07609 [Abscondita terminalis]|nr:hypothetical protein FQR65_LT07609 [Abscondita terminalis]